MNEKKILSLLGIARKAGKTVMGTDMTVESIRKKASSVKVVLLASDASQNTFKRIKNTAEYYGTHLTVLNANKKDLAALMGRGEELSVIGITDDGFAKAMAKAEKDEINQAL